jgi:glycosyltransferase involved in cell wall biosynthesis
MTTVSVVIPYYNRAEWLWLAVESVLAQTFRDFEIIVVDDGSEEEPRLHERFTDARIRYVRQEHRGASSARNHGLRLATGKYVAFLDADDVFLPEKLLVQVAQMDAHPGIALSHTSYVRIDTMGRRLEEIPAGRFRGRVYPDILLQCPIATPTVMVRRATLDEQRLRFEESVSIGEDIILWIDLARHHSVFGIDQPLTKVRMHGKNADSDPESQYRGRLDILRHAFRKDPTFSMLYRRRAFAGVCSETGQFFLELGDQKKALRYFGRGLIYWPADLRSLSIVVRLALPPRLRAILRSIRATMRQGRTG